MGYGVEFQSNRLRITSVGCLWSAFWGAQIWVESGMMSKEKPCENLWKDKCRKSKEQMGFPWGQKMSEAHTESNCGWTMDPEWGGRWRQRHSDRLFVEPLVQGKDLGSYTDYKVSGVCEVRELHRVFDFLKYHHMFSRMSSSGSKIKQKSSF